MYVCLCVSVCMYERADFRLEHTNSWSRRADLRPERADFRPEKANLRSRRADFRPEDSY